MRRGTTVTLADVAREARVSRSTASEALGGTGRMTSTTRSAVVAAAAALGYRPNAVAQSLRTGRTHSIGLHHLDAVESFASEYFREFVAGALDVAQRRDYDVTLLSSNSEAPRQALPRVDGLIIVDPISDDMRAYELLESGLPIIAGERYPPGMPTSPVVGVAHEPALRSLLDRAYAFGVRRPALVVPDTRSGWGIVLQETFREWCGAHGLSGPVRPSGFGEFSVDQHRSRIAELLLSEPELDLLVVSSEAMVAAAIDFLRDLPPRPGPEVLIVCCAEARVLSMTDPQVSAIDLHPRALGSACAQVLIDQVEGSDVTPPALTLIDADPVLRGVLAEPTRVHVGR